MKHSRLSMEEREVRVSAGPQLLEANLSIPKDPHGVVLFAHSSGSSRLSPKNRQVAQALNDVHLATLLLNLLSADEEKLDLHTAELRFDIGLLAERMVGATQWLMSYPDTKYLSIGYFGASTGAAAALVAAAAHPELIRAVVCRGARTDLAEGSLPAVKAPTLLIVGGKDFQVLDMNRAALEKLSGEKQLVIVPAATHLFPEHGKMNEVARLARSWFEGHLVPEEAHLYDAGLTIA